MHSQKSQYLINPSVRSELHLTVDVVTTQEELHALADDWRSLEIRAARPDNYFQSFAWHNNWSRLRQSGASGGQYDIFIVTIRNHKELLLVWPLMMTTRHGMKVLTWHSEPLLQYGDCLTSADERIEICVELAWQRICSEPGVDLIRLDNVLQTSPLFDFLKRTNISCLNEAETCAQLDLTRYPSHEDFVAAQAKSTRRGRRKRHNKLASMGDLDFCVHMAGPRFESAVQQSITWKREWLDQRKLPDLALAWDKTGEFFTRLANQQTSVAYPLAAVLTLDDEPIACELGFVYGTNYYSYLGAYDPNFACFSAGKVQIDHMVAWCIGQKLKVFDLLGNDTSFKSDWSNSTTARNNFWLAKSLRAKVYANVWRPHVRPRCKELYQSSAPTLRTFLRQVVK